MQVDMTVLNRTVLVGMTENEQGWGIHSSDKGKEQ